MKQLWAVWTANFDDTLYYESAEDAEGFVKDQKDMEFWAFIISAYEYTDEDAERLLATMEELDPQVVRWLAEQGI